MPTFGFFFRTDPLLKKGLQLPRPVYDGDDLQGCRLPPICNHVRVDGPETVPCVGQVFPMVTDPRHLPEACERVVQPRQDLVRVIDAASAM